MAQYRAARLQRFKPRAFEAGEDYAGCAWLIEEDMLADIDP